ncbi:MAG: PEP-CTERM sorting domain-containing protein, partial [Rivularia sp. ALOHA_DT_140]|nr:PEP-CTERM sorting domain-containing protein [Rivularia sp. ALOHA_DT_140]
FPVPRGIKEGYDAWNAWGRNRVSGCDANGEECSKGWLNGFSISSDDFTKKIPNVSPYATPLIALQNALNTTFTLTSDSTVNFFFRDTNYRDNFGGVSLKLSSVQAVPEPASVLGLLAVGSIAVSGLKRKKQAV